MSTIGKDFSKEFVRFFIVYDQSKPTSDDLWQTGFHADPSGRIKFWEDQEGEQIIGTERECILKKQLADCPALAPLSFADAKKEMNLTQRDMVKFLINYGDKEAFKECQRDIGNPIDHISPGDFEDANNDQAQRAVQLMGLNLAQLLKYNRLTSRDIIKLGGMVRREHYPDIATLVNRLEDGDWIGPQNGRVPEKEAQMLFMHSCEHLPDLALYLLNNTSVLQSTDARPLRSAYIAGSFPLAKALIAKGVSPEDPHPLIVLKFTPNPNLLSRLMGIPAFRLSSAPKTIHGLLTAQFIRLQDYECRNNEEVIADNLNVLYQHKPKICPKYIRDSAKLLLCCMRHNSNHAEAMNATKALAKTILSSFDEPKKKRRSN